MKASDLIRDFLQMSHDGTVRIVSDMRDEPLTPSTPGAKGGDGNHTLWTLGHLAFIESTIPYTFFGESMPFGHWAPMFAPGSKPTSDAGRYPSFDEVFGAYQKQRSHTIGLLDRLGEDGIDRIPKNVPPGFEGVMKTCGHTMMLIAMHNMVHYGQVADARRVAGRTALM